MHAPSPLHLALESLPNDNIYRILSHIDPIDRVRVQKCSQRMKSAIEQSDLNETAIHFNSMPLTLETLPKENLYRILSHIDLKDRVRVRECSKTMREAIEQSVFITSKLIIDFEGGRIMCPHLHFGDKRECLTACIRKGSKSFRDLQSRQLRMFRFARIGDLTIHFKYEIDEKVLEQVIGLHHFQSLNVHLYKHMQPSVLNLVQRFKGENRSFHLFYFTPDLETIIELPRMKTLEIDSYFMAISDYFSADQILQIIGKDHEDIVLPMKLFRPDDLFRIIRAVQANGRVRALTLHVPSVNFYRNFLRLMDIQEGIHNLLNISDANSPIDLGRMVSDPGRTDFMSYYLSYGPGYLRINSTNSNIHRVCIVKETLPQYLSPSHNFTLPS